jgi:8-oxo-dGTP diphosphatase
MSMLGDSSPIPFRLPIALVPVEADRVQLLELIRHLSPARRSLSSSAEATGSRDLDLRAAATHPAAARLAARFLLAEAARQNANRVGGPISSAGPLVGAALSLVPASAGAMCGFTVFASRPEHESRSQIEGHLGPGDRALVCDEAVADGGSMLQAIEAVRAAGAVVAGGWCLVDHDQGGREKLAAAGVSLTAVFPWRELLGAPRRGEPPEEPCEPGAPADSAREVGAASRGSAPAGPWRPVTPVLAADAIIELTPGRILLIRRKNPPLGWALPGGFVEVGESVEEAVRREILEETGLSIEDAVQMHTYSAPGRDPRLPTVTVVFAARASGTPVAGDDAGEARLFSFDGLPSDLCFDHRQVLEDYRTSRFGVGPGTIG